MAKISDFLITSIYQLRHIQDLKNQVRRDDNNNEIKSSKIKLFSSITLVFILC